MKGRITDRPLYLLITFIILYSILPFVSRLTSSTISTYGYLLVISLAFLATAGTDLNAFISMMLPLICYCLLTFFTRADSIVLWGYQSVLFIIPVVLGVYTVYYAQNIIQSMKQVIKYSVIITSITTIIGCVQYPSAARYLATVVDANDPYNVLLEWRNIAGYSFVYFVVLLYPMWIFAFKRRKIGVVSLILGVIVAFSTAILTEYTTALLLLMVSSLFLFFKRDLKVRDVVILGVVALAIILMANSFISDGLEWLSEKIGSKDMSDRLLALSGGQSGLENAEDNRIFLYRRSLNSFLSSPLWGNLLGGYNRIGGHSAILDTLGQYGVIGGVTLIFMYKKIYNLLYKPFDDYAGYGYFFWTFIQAIILSFLNTGLWFQVIGCFAPIIFISIAEEENIEGSVDY